VSVAILVRILINAVALLITAYLVPDISFTGNWVNLIVAGAIFGLFNLIVRPIVVFLSIPALILTLGLFYFVMNGLLLWAASFILPGYKVNGLIAGILGSLVISIVNWLFAIVLGGDKSE
jgi:putative membrane protein